MVGIRFNLHKCELVQYDHISKEENVAIYISSIMMRKNIVLPMLVIMQNGISML